MNPEIQKIIEVLKEWQTIASKGLTSTKNLKRDGIILLVCIMASGLLFFRPKLNFNWDFNPNFNFNFKPKIVEFFERQRSEKVAGEESIILSEEQIFAEVRMVQETLDLANWKTHQSQWYGVEVKYPESWLVPKNQGFTRGSNWEYRYQFRKKIVEENNPYAGFDLVIYNLTKIKDISATAEFPTIKNETLKKEGKCEYIAGHLIETGDYPAEEIFIPPTDDCYNPALFFSFTKDQYIYNIVPVFSDKAGIIGDMQVEVTDNFPEFFGVVSTLKITDMVRPRPVVKPRINAPRPFAATNGSGFGRLTCAKKNDNPSKSNTNKKGHLDMECCLDPDEIPNPWCNYSSNKYKKLLK
jgi:hypothetical protein